MFCFVLFRFVFNRFAPSLVLCLFSFTFTCSRLNGSTIRQKGTFKNICVEKLSWLFSVFYFVFTFRSLFAWIILLQFCLFSLSFCLSVLFFNALYSLALLFSSFVDLLVIFCTVALLCCELLALLFHRHFLSIPNPRVFNCIAFSVCWFTFLVRFFFALFCV